MWAMLVRHMKPQLVVDPENWRFEPLPFFCTINAFEWRHMIGPPSPVIPGWEPPFFKMAGSACADIDYWQSSYRRDKG